MKIAIDLRSLSSGQVSGVENYTVNLVEHLLKIDTRNEYVLFYNSFEKGLPRGFDFVNSRTVRTRIPNKFLNLAFKLNLKKIEDLTGKVDSVFMPNLNQISLLSKTKLFLTVHDMSPVVTPEFYDLKRRLWHKFLNYKNSFTRSDKIFAVSEYTKQDLIRLFNLPAQKILVVYPGVDQKIYTPGISEKLLRQTRNTYELPAKFLLFLNTLEPRKNLTGLIQAFENLQDSECHLVIAGRPGWKYGKIMDAINHSKKKKLIKYLGYLPEHEKPGVIKLADALVYPSFYEGFGFQPLEAAALGVPSIVSQVTSLPEVMGDSALLVNPYNLNSLTEAMQQILTNRNLRQTLVQKGEKRVKDFNWEKTARIILESFSK